MILKLHKIDSLSLSKTAQKNFLIYAWNFFSSLFSDPFLHVTLLFMERRIENSLNLCARFYHVFNMEMQTRCFCPRHRNISTGPLRVGVACWWVITGRKILPVSQRSFPSVSASYEYLWIFSRSRRARLLKRRAAAIPHPAARRFT